MPFLWVQVLHDQHFLYVSKMKASWKMPMGKWKKNMSISRLESIAKEHRSPKGAGRDGWSVKCPGSLCPTSSFLIITHMGPSMRHFTQNITYASLIKGRWIIWTLTHFCKWLFTHCLLWEGRGPDPYPALWTEEPSELLKPCSCCTSLTTRPYQEPQFMCKSIRFEFQNAQHKLATAGFLMAPVQEHPLSRQW